MRRLTVRLLISLSVVPAMLAMPGIASSQATTKVVRDFKVQFIGEPTRLKGKRAMWIKTIAITGKGVSRTRPRVRCDQKNCLKRRRNGRYRKSVKKNKITFRNVNWVITKRQTVTVALHQKKHIGRFRRVGPAGKQADRLVVKAAGCLREEFKRRKCPPKTEVVAPGTPEPTTPVTPPAPAPGPAPTTPAVPAPDPPPRQTDRLSNGCLAAEGNELLYSGDGRFRFVMQGDSNLVLYGPSGNALWASNTFGRGATKVCMQPDGNLVIYDGGAVAIWASNTYGNWDSPLLIVQNDGNVVIYAGGRAIWSTNTMGRT